MSHDHDSLLLFHSMRLAASVDGKLTDDERACLHALLAVLPDFADIELDSLATASDALAKKHGGLLESAEALAELSTPALKAKAYLLAAEVSHASESVSPIESELLRMIRNLLQINQAQAKHIDEVLALKYSTAA